MIREENTLDNTTPVALPDRAEVAMAIQGPKFNKASGYDGLPSELFNVGGDDLVRCMRHLLCNIWSLESMPSDWCLSLLCPVLKNCSNYRGISFLSIAYRILSSVLYERLKPSTTGSYQC